MFPKNTPANVEKLAREFVDQLRSCLTDEQMAEVVTRNKAEQNPNECMQDAYFEVFPGIAWHEIDQCDPLWSAAWAKACEWEFKCPN